MTIQIGERAPDATLFESTEFGEFCPAKPASFSAADALKGKSVVVFALPGAYTPTCSAKHVPGYVEHRAAFAAKGVDEVWCVSVNDGYVMAAWGRDEKALGKVRMLGDGAAEWTKKLGFDQELAGMGVRSKRYAMWLVDGVVKALRVEAPGQFEVSSAEAMLKVVG